MYRWVFSCKACSKTAVCLLTTFLPLTLNAAITGVCSDCHTMHNSQNSQPMVAGSGQPQELLLRGGCVGCHAQNSGQKIVTINGTQYPQVMHTDATGDLAAGNFAYITGAKGSGALDSKGHNVRDLVAKDSRLDYPPGAKDASHQAYLTSSKLTCAGNIGCHGYRLPEVMDNEGIWWGTGMTAIRYTHHSNVEGLISGIPNDTYDSYRFLDGVNGLENPDPAAPWQNLSSASHNEYLGVSNPGAYTSGGWGDSCAHCHAWDDNIRPSNRTISGFCATCHPNFHSLSTDSSPGISSNTTSPFLRHPTDIVIKDSDEYASYTTYDVKAPVGRQNLPAFPSGEVTPGSDTVTCLSCHMAHASNYPAMLRWDYVNDCVAGTQNSDCGCFICHSTKD